MVIKLGVLENKRRRRRGDKGFFFVFGRKIGRTRGICGTQTLFWYNIDFKCYFGIFFQKNMGLWCNLDSCFQ
jgi:hypothetical protein